MTAKIGILGSLVIQGSKLWIQYEGDKELLKNFLKRAKELTKVMSAEWSEKHSRLKIYFDPSQNLFSIQETLKGLIDNT